METLMDLEEITRRLYTNGKSEDHIIGHLESLGLSHAFSKALLLEIRNSESLEGLDDNLKDLITCRSTGLAAGSSGLGSRGEGDFIIHRSIARIASSPTSSRTLSPSLSPTPSSHSPSSSLSSVSPPSLSLSSSSSSPPPPSPPPSSSVFLASPSSSSQSSSLSPSTINPSHSLSSSSSTSIKPVHDPIQGGSESTDQNQAGNTGHDQPGSTGNSVVVGPESQDDGGVVRINDGTYLVTAVDGLHSRIGHFPYLAGFHVARACLRDVLVMGAEPVALFSDVHLGNDGDPAAILDYTAGISTVGELLGVPLIAGSTLRIAGDLVTGDRLSGAAGAVGRATHLTPRKAAEPGDVLIMTSGSGGGTIASAAIFHGKADVLEETLNIDFLRFTKEFLKHPLIEKVHALTDVTNGGIRGDLHEMAGTAEVDMILYPERFLGLINPKVLEMLDSLSIDPLGVSVDTLLVVCPADVGSDVLSFMRDHGMHGDIIGTVEEPRAGGDVEGGGKKGEARGSDLIDDGVRRGQVFFEDQITDPQDGRVGEMRRRRVKPLFRESPYTPVKAVADKHKVDPDVVKHRMHEAVDRALKKKEWMMDRLSED